MRETWREREIEVMVVHLSGFGALIRSMGMQINKNRSRDACRDLSGRRMRDVNAEKK